MGSTTPFRFGVQHHGTCGAKEWAELARKVEDLGFSTLTLPDHFESQFAPGPGLAAAAAATTTLKLGTLVYCNDYRHPVVLAKEVATLDLLSDGRLELGIGAGWMTTDYERAGMAKDPAGTRIERLSEAIDVVEGLLGDESFSYEGTHYRINELDGQPKPVQRPRPPLVLGGGGRRMLTLAANRADIVGINVSLASGEVGVEAAADATHARTEAKLQWIRDAAGERLGEIELQCQVAIAIVTDDRDAIIAETAPAFGLTADEAAATPHALVGTTEEIVEQLIDRRERYGISYIGLHTDVLEAFGPVVAQLAEPA